MAELPIPPMPTVDAIFEAREAEAASRPRYDAWGISASELGSECDRSLFYTLRWTSPTEVISGRKHRIFERGDIEEGRVIADLRRAGIDVLDRDPVTEKQFRFAMANGFIRGKADGLGSGFPEAPKTEHVIEIKSLSAADWRGIIRHGLRKHKPMHWHQLHAGVIALGRTRGIYIGVNKDTEEILAERIHADVEEGNRQEARILRLVDMNEAPGRIADKPDSFACKFCRHHGHCHSEAPARRNCRTCLHFTFTADGAGHCDRFDQPRAPSVQGQGDCPAHLYLPAFVHGEQIDADPDAETITYRLKDGSEWTDGARHEVQP